MIVNQVVSIYSVKVPAEEVVVDPVVVADTPARSQPCLVRWSVRASPAEVVGYVP